MTSPSLLITIIALLLEVDNYVVCFTSRSSSMSRSGAMQSSRLRQKATVAHYGGYRKEQGAEHDIEREASTYLPDQETIKPATTTQHYLSSTSPKSIEETMEDLNFQRSELETFDAAAQKESIVSSNDEEEVDITADISPNLDVVKQYSYASPFSHRFDVNQRSHAVHTHRQTYSYTYSPTGNSIDSTDIPSVQDLIVPSDEKGNVIYAGFFEDFAKAAEGVPKTEEVAYPIPDELATSVTKESTVNYSFQPKETLKIQYPSSTWKRPPLTKTSYRGHYLNTIDSNTPSIPIEGYVPKKSYFYSIPKSRKPRDGVSTLGNYYLQSCSTNNMSTTNPLVTPQSSSVQAQARESKKAYLNSIMASYSRKVQDDADVQPETKTVSEPVIDNKIFPDFSSVQSQDDVKNNFLQSVKNSLLTKQVDTITEVVVTSEPITLPGIKIYPDFSSVQSRTNEAKTTYLRSIKNSLLPKPQDATIHDQMESIKYFTSHEIKICPDFSTVLSQVDSENKYFQSIKQSLSTQFEDITNYQLDAALLAYTTTYDDIKIYPDFSSVQANDINSIYLQSIKNSLSTKNSVNAISNDHAVKPAIASENITPSVVININSALMSKKAETIVEAITKEIEAMENENAAVKDLKSETAVATVFQFQSKVSGLFATVDKFAESHKGLFDNSVLSMNKALDGAGDYLKNKMGAIPNRNVSRPNNAISSTPGAKALAKKIGLNFGAIEGTGNYDRVTADDVKLASNSCVNADDVKLAAATGEKKSGVVPFTPMQRGISKNMESSLSTPVFRLTRKIDMENFDKLYHKLKTDGVSVSSLLAKAVGVCIEKHPIMNSSYKDGGIQHHDDINISMAVAIDGGLYTPTLRKTNDKNVFELSKEWRTLIRKTKKNKLTADESTSATFAISNLGMFGVKSFDAVLPPGMGCILAIASAQPIVLPDKKSISGSRVAKNMSVTITCDHRHIYGADAAKFMQSLADILENNVETLED